MIGKILFLILSLVVSLRGLAFNEATQTVTLDGVLFKKGTTSPLLDPNVEIKVQIINPTGSCLLYEEKQSVNTSASKGYFSIQVGSALSNTKRTIDDPGNLMARVFQNTAAITANSISVSSCVGNSYVPSAGDVRYFRLTVTPSESMLSDRLSPDIVMDSVPQAIVAQSVQGLERANILAANTAGTISLTQSNLESLFTGSAWTNLQNILLGNFLRTDSSGATLPAYASTPAGVSIGDMWYDSATNQIKYQTNAGTQTVGGSVTGDNITSGTISGTTGINSSGNLITSGTISGANLNGNLITGSTITGSNVQATNLRIYNGSQYVQLTAQPMSASINLALPTSVGISGQILATNGSGAMNWISAGDSLSSLSCAAWESVWWNGSAWVCASTASINSTGTLMRRDGSGNFASNQATLNSLKIDNGSGSQVTVVTPVAFSSWQLRLPATAGTVSQVLQTDGSGNTTWATVTVNPSGGNSQVQFNNSGSFGADGNFVWDNTNKRLGIGAASPNEKLEVNGAIKIGTTSATNAGTIRWDGTNFSGYTGSAWVHFVPSPPTSGSCDSTVTYNAPGTYAYTVPANFGTITIKIWGAGGSGGYVYSNEGPRIGQIGGASSISSLGLVASGGQGGATAFGGNASAASGGTATGGSVNTNGNASSSIVLGSTVAPGAAAPNGGAGGAANGQNGLSPGGGGAGSFGSGGQTFSAVTGGGSGAYVEKSFNSISLMPGSNISDVVVGTGGGVVGAYPPNGVGGNGQITITCVSAGALNPNDRSIAFYSAGSFSADPGFVYSATGQVGIGVSSPTSALDVSGAIKSGERIIAASSVQVGADAATCAAGNKGAMRYNSGSNAIEFCNGSAWTMIVSSSCSDSTPAAFAFSNESNASTSTVVVSNILQITGINCSVAVQVSGQGSPQVRVCADSGCSSVLQDWTSAVTSIDNNQYLQARLTSDSVGGSNFVSTLIVGSSSSSWFVTTAGGDCVGSTPAVGTICADGTIYAGLSPDGSVKMFTTRCDAGQTWNGTSCTGARSVFTFNNGTSNYANNSLNSWITGKANSSALAGYVGAAAPYAAATYCETLSADGNSDWYLPAMSEISVLYSGVSSIKNFDVSGNYYWSSSESGSGSNRAFVMRLSDGYGSDGYTTTPWHSENSGFYVRCVRR